MSCSGASHNAHGIRCVQHQLESSLTSLCPLPFYVAWAFIWNHILPSVCSRKFRSLSLRCFASIMKCSLLCSVPDARRRISTILTRLYKCDAGPACSTQLHGQSLIYSVIRTQSTTYRLVKRAVLSTQAGGCYFALVRCPVDTYISISWCSLRLGSKLWRSGFAITSS
jgi:hypothetical protein